MEQSDRTKREIEAGRRAVMRIWRATDIAELKAAGFQVPNDMNEQTLEVNLLLARGVGAVPGTDESRCRICQHMHEKGSRCPNSARKFVTTMWSDGSFSD